MVSSNPVSAEIPSVAPRHDRGFFVEETVMSAGPGVMPIGMYGRPFWTPIIAGTLFVLSAFMLSWYLMLGFHVGIDQAGMLALGGGAAVWMWITAAVAYFCGAMMAGAMMPAGSGWIKGGTLWGLSIPLAGIVYAFAAQTGMLMPLGLPHPGTPHLAGEYVGAAPTIHFAWASFIGLAVGLIFSVIGSFAGIACRMEEKVTGTATR